jgi:RNA polymerase sigma factor (TIGR02999 family)
MNRLMPLVYDSLHRIAARSMRREDAGHTLQPTALLNEAYLRLIEERAKNWHNREQFFSIASRMMRRILVDHARSRIAAKRGGGVRCISLENATSNAAENADIIALDDALTKLESLDGMQARLIELRYFSGFSIDETAMALEVSPSTVKREWATARAWLARELG